MLTRQALARRAGALYFLFMLLGIYSEFFVPRVLVPGNPSATADNIRGAELAYRSTILVGFATHVVFLFLVVALYRLLGHVDRTQAVLMVVLVSVGVSVALANMLNRFGPTVLLSGPEYLGAFAKPQVDALALASLRFRMAAAAVPLAFWGLWLFPFGALVRKSRFLPPLLGLLLSVAGFAYVVTSVTSILLPAYRQSVNQVLMPLYLGEVPIIFWLLLKGARPVPPSEVS